MVYIVTAVAVIAAIPVVVFLAWSAFAWWVPPRAPRGPARRRVLVIVPAHDEEQVIGRLLDDLSAQTYPPERCELHVIADRCVDGTSTIAQKTAIVHERVAGPGTKGAAIAWFLDLTAIGDDDLVVVLDADNQVGPDFVRGLVDAIDEGERAVQAYIEPSNPDASSVALAGAISTWLSNRLIDLPRGNLGVSCGIAGTGFALVGSLVEEMRSDVESTVEDQDLSDRLAVRGVRVRWLHRVRVLDEKPATLAVLANQRARWAEGERGRRGATLAMLASGPGRWSLTRIDRMLRILLPGRIISATVLIGVGVIGAIWPSALAFSPLWILGLISLVVVVSVAALLVEGAGPNRIVRIPLLFLFALSWIPERVMGRRQGGWYHTPHGEVTDD